VEEIYLMDHLTFQEKYNAITKMDSSYEGIIITAVKTTGIFCRPTCRARKPKPENVEFYNTVQEAIQNGYRPCKLCKPMEKMDETPEYIRSLLHELHEDSNLRLKDYDLRQRGIEPSQIRRWFKKHHNITFHAYQRMLRINAAFNSIKQGESVINAAFENGYESLSSLNEGFQSIFGEPPTKTQEKAVLNIVRFTTPIGPMFACASTTGLCLLEFTDRRMLETEFKDLCKRLNTVILPGKNIHLDRVQTEIGEYFSGKRKSFTIPLHTPGINQCQSLFTSLFKFWGSLSM
jgi:AraC family transcriptional regulator, regulatory protein of adaptative response / methylated-DNA-[protein]-cysteine methyltransferase